jgi:mitochondrial-processing peptidase subunit alpha
MYKKTHIQIEMLWLRQFRRNLAVGIEDRHVSYLGGKNNDAERLKARQHRIGALNQAHELSPDYDATNQSGTVEKQSVKTTTLDNGVRVVSEETFAPAGTVGVMIDVSDSCTGAADKFGIVKAMERMAFKSTRSRAVEELDGVLEELGISLKASGQREVIVLSADGLRSELESMLEVVADTVQSSAYVEREFDEQMRVADIEVDGFMDKPSMWLEQELHAAAFRSSRLGMPLLPASFAALSAADVVEFARDNYVAPRIVVAGAGVDHERFVGVAERLFGGGRTRPVDADVAARQAAYGADSPHAPPIYNGNLTCAVAIEERMNALRERQGEAREALVRAGQGDAAAQMYHLNAPIEMPEFTHVSVALRAPSLNGDDFYVAATVASMLGGGTAFSAGGPGKGMYTRLFTDGLNRYQWLNALQAFFTGYKRTGLFVLRSECEHGHLVNALMLIGSHLNAAAFAPPGDEELGRAKNLLKSQVFSALESRAVHFDDLARQTTFFGRCRPAAEHMQRIDAITAEDIARVAHDMLESGPIIGAYAPKSHLDALPSPKSLASDMLRRH